MFPFGNKFCKFFSLTEIWGRLTHFSIAKLSCIFDSMLKSGLTVVIFNISAFSIVLCLFLLHRIEIFTIAHNFWKKYTVKHCLIVVK